MKRRWTQVEGEAPHVFPVSDWQPPPLPDELIPVAEAMLQHPKGWIAGSYEGPRGNDWVVDVCFVHDGDRRWRIESPNDLALHDGASAFVLEDGFVRAYRSDSLATHNFLKAMLAPSRFADLDRQLPMLRHAEVQDIVDHEGRSCWRLAVSRDDQIDHWVIERDTGRVMSVSNEERTARIFKLSDDPHPSELFTWDGPVDEDERVVAD